MPLRPCIFRHRMLHAAPDRPRLRSAPFAALCLAGLLGAGLPAPASAQTPSSVPNADAIVRQAVANRLASDALWRPVRFVFHKKDQSVDFTKQIIQTHQGDVALMILINGRRLGPKARQAQIARLDNLAAHPALQEHRLKSEQADQTRIDTLLRLLPTAFIYRYQATVPCNVTEFPQVPIPRPAGQTLQPAHDIATTPSTCYRIGFAPNPDFAPPSLESRIFQGMAGEVWIETSNVRLFRLDAHLQRDVTFGWGIIGRLNQGGTVSLQQNELAPHLWELTQMRMNLTGKALLFKSLRFHIDEEMSDFEPVPPNLNYKEAIRILKAEAR